MLYNIFSEFLEDITEDVLPNDLTGYQDSLVWKKLFNFQRDAATGIINKLETYNGCILADSVGLGKTFTALAVVKYYELRNRSVLVLCPKKLADNWLTYNRNLDDQHLRQGSLQLRRALPHRPCSEPAANRSARRSTASTGATTTSSSSTSRTTSATTTPSRTARPAIRS